MKLHSLSICGFRGFREKLEVDFASGFTVISGRNGVGKSTIFDAIEYVITGRIDKYKVSKSGNESLEDYLWWRGDGKSESHYVTLKFIDDDDNIFSITRDRVKGLDMDLNKIEALLCASKTKPIDALYQLCKTTIIRDELIAAYSLDLNETDRFELVRSALGVVDGIGYASRAHNVLEACLKAFKEAEKSYDEARFRLGNFLTDLTRTRDSAAKSGDVRDALRGLRAYISEIPDDIKQAISLTRDMVKKKRAILAGAMELLNEAKNILELKKTLDSRKEEIASIRLKTKGLRDSYKDINSKLLVAQNNLESERRSDEMAAALSALIQHGEHIGLQDGHCPLCAAGRSNKEFMAGIEAARVRLRELGGRMEAALAVEADLKNKISSIVSEIKKYEMNIEQYEELEKRTRDLEANHIKTALGYGAQNEVLQAINDPAKLEQLMLLERSGLIDLERHLLTLETSRTLNQIVDLELQIANIRKEVDKAAIRMSRCQKAIEYARTIDHAVKRTTHEIIDERLALINPLLSELYKRLRPHSNWRNIEYHIRGDVKRFLSLVVGKDLNPQFIFSSGQRRAAGIAFLLAVHLSRLWCKWKTIILDDPVQHIDDFRALHLVEVLSSLRREGYQIVCAVEDGALANLLCRRLRNGKDAIGYRYDLDYGPSGGINVTENKVVSSLPQNLLTNIPIVSLPRVDLKSFSSLKGGANFPLLKPPE